MRGVGGDGVDRGVVGANLAEGRALFRLVLGHGPGPQDATPAAGNHDGAVVDQAQAEDPVLVRVVQGLHELHVGEVPALHAHVPGTCWKLRE